VDFERKTYPRMSAKEANSVDPNTHVLMDEEFKGVKTAGEGPGPRGVTKGE